jgi:hypothetical protein
LYCVLRQQRWRLPAQILCMLKPACEAAPQDRKRPAYSQARASMVREATLRKEERIWIGAGMIRAPAPGVAARVLAQRAPGRATWVLALGARVLPPAAEVPAPVARALGQAAWAQVQAARVAWEWAQARAQVQVEWAAQVLEPEAGAPVVRAQVAWVEAVPALAEQAAGVEGDIRWSCCALLKLTCSGGILTALSNSFSAVFFSMSAPPPNPNGSSDQGLHCLSLTGGKPALS